MSSRWLRILALALVVTPVAIPAARMSSPTAADTAPQSPRFSAESEVVVLHVSVTDKKGSYVSGLPQDVFTVLEENHQQPIGFFMSQDAPVTVGLLIDSSGSMQPSRDRVIAAATAFAETSNPEDEIFALVFNEDVRPALPAITPFTSDATALRLALTRSIRARGRTALYDAVSAGLDYVSRGTRERKVLVVVSDGGDNASQASADQILTRTEASNVVVNTVGLMDGLEREANPRILKRLAETSGGAAFRPHDVKDVTGVLRHIAGDIRHAYTIGYTPTNPAHDGTLRRVRVTVHSPGRSVLIRTRIGYVAGRASEPSQR
jgi:Ca-activated chloride channel family protein